MTAWQPIDTIDKTKPIFLARREWSKVVVYVTWWDGDDEFPWAFMEDDGLINGLDDDRDAILGWAPIDIPAPPPISGAGQNEEGRK